MRCRSVAPVTEPGRAASQMTARVNSATPRAIGARMSSRQRRIRRFMRGGLREWDVCRRPRRRGARRAGAGAAAGDRGGLGAGRAGRDYGRARRGRRRNGGMGRRRSLAHHACGWPWPCPVSLELFMIPRHSHGGQVVVTRGVSLPWWHSRGDTEGAPPPEKIAYRSILGHLWPGPIPSPAHQGAAWRWLRRRDRAHAPACRV